jgi:hypothetical protein
MDATTEAKWRRQRRWAIIFLYMGFGLAGARAGLLAGLPESRLSVGLVARTDLLVALFCSLGSMWFCTLDSRLSGKPIIQLAKLGIFLLWPVGVPVYLLWAHRLRGLGLLLLHGCGVCLTALATAIVTACLLYGFTWFS